MPVKKHGNWQKKKFSTNNNHAHHSTFRHHFYCGFTVCLLQSNSNFLVLEVISTFNSKEISCLIEGETFLNWKISYLKKISIYVDCPFLQICLHIYVDSTNGSPFLGFTNVTLFLWSYNLSKHVWFPSALDHFAPVSQVNKKACTP